MDRALFLLSDYYLEKADEICLRDQGKLLGDICLNRVAGIAYLNLRKIKQNNVSSEFMRTLNRIYDSNCEESKWFTKCVEYLADIFKDVTFEYAFLKGAYLITKVYEKGLRTSSDIDVLVKESDISNCEELLLEHGFVQGSYIAGKGIVKASRKEVLFSRMNYGETIPFWKSMEGRLFMLDINFSVDFKPDGSNGIVEELLRSRQLVNYRQETYYTLNKEDFFIHLCCHLYKEATTMEWVKTNRDLSLYKFSDINIYLRSNILKGYEDLKTRIVELGVCKECYFSIVHACDIYPDLRKDFALLEMIKDICPNNLEFMNEIIDPLNKKKYRYDISFEEWFAASHKLDKLTEVSDGN